jgi:hypothetical protein
VLVTATEVRGLAVLADEPAPAPLTAWDGKQVFWEQTRLLLLEDGTTTFGCKWCVYTNDNLASIRPHLGGCKARPGYVSRSDKVAAARAEVEAPAVVDEAVPVEALVKRLRMVDELEAKLARVTEDRDRWMAKAQTKDNTWKARALKAERDLANLRRILGGALG